MNCQRARDVFPELLDSRLVSPKPGVGGTTATAHLDARTHLAHCPDCQREFAALTQTAHALDTMSTPPPSPRLRKNFYAMLEEEKHSAASVRAVAERKERARRGVFWRWVLIPLGACALVALGFALGKRALPAASQVPAESRTERELAVMQKKLDQYQQQLTKMTTLVSYQILQQQQNPANERLQSILARTKDATPTDKDIDVLIQAVMLDPNANVRLRAIEALYPHAERDVVRAGVLTALPREQNPLVQLELIDFVALTQDPDATPVLEKIAGDDAANTTVRDAARLALAHL